MIENRIEMLSTSGGAGGWQNIRNLQKEREYLRQRQQEIQNQVSCEGRRRIIG